MDPLAWLQEAAAQAPAAQPTRTSRRTDDTEPTAGRWAWTDRAACLGADPDLFFPYEAALTSRTKGHVPAHLMAAARTHCDRCPVRPDCLDHALHHETIGIWAATDPHGLARLRRTLGINVAADTDPTPTTSEDTAA